MKRYVLTLLLVLSLLLLAALFTGLESMAQDGVIELDSGLISGQFGDGYRYYLGIPFAAPPVGELRWKPPQPVEPWAGVRESTEFGPACRQVQLPFLPDSGLDEDEGCLYLNVWTPAMSPDDRLPVMVWIHGGGFQVGSASETLYDGSSLAKKGVVIVTINYRLGPLGFLAHPELAEESPEGLTGNYGILDQIAALEWVQRNIAAFGGDPAQVTIFGESAGGMSVIALLGSPLTEGLFHRAIAQSAPILARYLWPQPDSEDLEDLDRALAQGRTLARNLGCDEASDVLACMRAKTPEDVLAAIPAIGGAAPVGDDRVVSKAWLSPLDEGAWHDVPLIIGTNADEWGITLGVTPESLPAYQPWESYVQAVFGERAEKLLALFPADTPEALWPVVVKLHTAAGFACPSKFVAEVRSEQLSSPTYVYELTRVPDWEGKMFGAFHGLDIGYVFGGPRLLMEQIEYEAEDEALSEIMMDYWTAFAATGDPNVPGRSHWPVYDPASDEHLELDVEVTVKSGLFEEVCDILR